MRTKDEITKEIKRCEIECDLCASNGVIKDEIKYRMFNDRLWALKWVLETEEK